MQEPWDSCIFDLDGTLWNSVAEITAIWNDVLAAADCAKTLSEDDVIAIMGLTTEEIGDALLAELPPSQRRRLMSACTKAEKERLPHIGGKLYPDVKETLATLGATLPLFIVSNCDLGYIEAFLSYHHLEDVFSDFLSYGHTGEDKPANIAAIVAKHRLKNAVYIGDTAKDRRSAQKAGVDFIYAAYGFGEVTDAAFSIAAFSDLPHLIFAKE